MSGEPVPAFHQALADLFRGTCGGISLTIVGHPFDTVKVRLQTQPIDKPIYRGAIDCVVQTVKYEGLQGLYKGVASPLLGQMFFRATLFGTYGQACRVLNADARRDMDLGMVERFMLAGAVTGFAAAFVESPVDFFKTQMQIQTIRTRTQGLPPRFRGVFDVAKNAVALNSWRGPFQGLTATLCRNVPANAVYFGCFEALRAAIVKRHNRNTTGLETFACGSAAGLCYWLLTYPLDVVKSAMMSDNIEANARRHQSYLGTWRSLWNEGGIKRMYRGFTPCLARAVPANGAIFLTVMELKKRMPY